MDKINQLVKSLSTARQNTLKNFNRITLNQKAAHLVVRLFYNPDCISLKNLDDLVNTNLVKLSDLSKVMLTAAPSTLAKYSNDHNKLLLGEDDIINCFANDHLQAVLKNKIDKIYQPEYALSHILLVGKIKKLYRIDNFKFADIKSTIKLQAVEFKKVLVPTDLTVKAGQSVWHHFGIVICRFDRDDNILKRQLSDFDFNSLGSHIRTTVLDFSDKKIFRRNVTGRIIGEQKNLKRRKKIISDPAISKIKPPMDQDIKFIH